MTSVQLSQARVAVYARFSSDRQSDASIDAQVARCTRYVTEAGGVVDPARVWTDYAISAASLQRPGLEAMLGAVRAGAIDLIVVEDLSRLSRDQADAHTLLRDLRHRGVAVVGVADGVDTREKGSKLLYSVRAMLSEAYLDDLRDKTLRGLEQRARSGTATGGMPYGYRTVARADGTRGIVIDEAQAAVVRRIYDEAALGKSAATIAASLNASGVAAPRSSRRSKPTWQHTTVHSILRNRAYTGTWTYGRARWTKMPGTNTRRPVARAPHEQIRSERPELVIVDAATWEAARPRSMMVPTGRKTYLLSGLVHCGACGAPMAISGSERRTAYQCSSARSRGTCTERRTVREADLRAGVLREVAEVMRRPEVLAIAREAALEVLDAVRAGGATERAERSDRIARNMLAAKRVAAAIAAGTPHETLQAVLGELEGQVREDRRALRALDAAVASFELPTVEELVGAVDTLEAELAGIDVARARAALRGLVGGSLRVDWTSAGAVARGAVMLEAVIANATAGGTRAAFGHRSDLAVIREFCEGRI